MQIIHGFDFYSLNFNRDGALENQGQFSELRDKAALATDIVFLAHGFRNNEQDATKWYTEFLKNFAAHVDSPEFTPRLGSRKWAIVGVYWPSKAVPEGPSKEDGSAQSLAGDQEAQRTYIEAQLKELQGDVRDDARQSIDDAIALLDNIEHDTDKQNQFVDKLLSSINSTTLDQGEGLEFLRSIEGSKVLEGLTTRHRRPHAQHDANDEDGGGASALSTSFIADGEDGSALGLGSFFGGVLGRVGQLVNLSTWYLMKERSGIVGARGVAQAVRDLKKDQPGRRVHLVGHSLGGRLMAACSKSLAESPMVQPDSVTLLQAAFSHYGFSKARSPRAEGFFRNVFDSKVVKGPFVATFSSLDDVVGRVYAIVSTLRGDNVKRLGDKNDQFGGIGANGAQQFENGEVISEPLHPVGNPYSNLKPGVLVCLDGSAKLINSHGDITSPIVTYAFASAVANTP